MSIRTELDEMSASAANVKKIGKVTTCQMPFQAYKKRGARKNAKGQVRFRSSDDSEIEPNIRDDKIHLRGPKLPRSSHPIVVLFRSGPFAFIHPHLAPAAQHGNSPPATLINETHFQ